MILLLDSSKLAAVEERTEKCKQSWYLVCSPISTRDVCALRSTRVGFTMRLQVLAGNSSLLFRVISSADEVLLLSALVVAALIQQQQDLRAAELRSSLLFNSGGGGRWGWRPTTRLPPISDPVSPPPRTMHNLLELKVIN